MKNMMKNLSGCCGQLDYEPRSRYWIARLRTQVQISEYVSDLIGSRSSRILCNPSFTTQIFIVLILFPLSNIHYPISIIQYPLSIIQYPLSNIHYPISVIQYPLSVNFIQIIHYSLLFIPYLFSITCYPLFVIHYLLSFICNPLILILYLLSFICYPLFLILYLLSFIHNHLFVTLLFVILYS